jgi:predicted metal-dependent phosphoesterase TrpH
VTLREPQGQREPGRGLIDLHLHTTASDGRCTPRQLVERASEAGLTTLAVTDHDTTAAVEETVAEARQRGIETVRGIEITAVHDGIDVHVLGYFIDDADPALQRFLVGQRALRVARVEAIVARLAELGMPVDLASIVERSPTDAATAVGRPQVARAMIARGYVASVQDAFDRWLSLGRPAFVPRSGASAESVVDIIHRARGLASLAHPGRTGIDARIEPLRDAGLDALEVFHTDHPPPLAERYLAIAERLGLLCTGGSDFHGDPSRPTQPGSTTLPQAHWERLAAARRRHA